MGMDMNKLMQLVGEMQEQMQKAQEELDKETVESSAGGGMVTVTATGSGEITQIKIDPKAACAQSRSSPISTTRSSIAWPSRRVNSTHLPAGH